MKAPFLDSRLYQSFLYKTNPYEKIKTTSRSSTIIDAFIGHPLSIHSGKAYKSIDIQPEMIGMKLGNLVYTKKQGASIHNSDHNRKKIAKMKRKISAKKIRKPTTKKAKAKTKGSRKKKM